MRISTLGTVANIGGATANAAALGAVANGSTAVIGSTLSSLGSGDTSAMTNAMSSSIADAAAMTSEQMQASSALAKMNMMSSINDALNSVMKKAGESFKSAAQ